MILTKILCLLLLQCCVVFTAKVGTSNLSSVSSKKGGPSSNLLATNNKNKNTDSGSSSTNKINQDGNDVAYYMGFSIGSSNQNFSLIVDTGSYYTWIYGAECTADACTHRQQYKLSNSTTVKNTTKDFSITYSSGGVKGKVVNDKALFSGFDTRINFGVANDAGSTFSSFPIDGLLGLSAKDQSDDAPGVITTLKKQGLIDKRIFGVNLGRNWDSKDEGGITFGDIDKSKYTGDISYTKVDSSSSNSNLLWNLPLDGVYLDDDEVDFGSGKRSCIVDTGTTLIVMPKDDAEKIHDKIEGSKSDDDGNYAVPCDSNMTIELKFNGKKWPMSSKDFLGPELDNDDGFCSTNIQGMDIPNQSKQWILGDAFLKGVYSVFDMDNQKVGFAKKSSSKTKQSPKDSIVLSSGLYHSLMPSHTRGTKDKSSKPSEKTASSSEDSSASSLHVNSLLLPVLTFVMLTIY